MTELAGLTSRRLCLPDDLRISTLRRLSRIEGQVRGMQRMVEQNRRCLDLLAQVTATSEALRRIEHIVMKSALAESAHVQPMKAADEFTDLLALIHKADS